jgi:hypothetical protein
MVLIFVRGSVDPRAIVQLEGLGKLKKIHLIGTQTRDFPACSIVPQPTPVLCAPKIKHRAQELKAMTVRLTWLNILLNLCIKSG